jgi:hypothetical protein
MIVGCDCASPKCRARATTSFVLDGTTHLVMSPLEFMQRLAALVPPGPEVQEQTTEVAAASECGTETVHMKPPEPRRPSQTPRPRL